MLNSFAPLFYIKLFAYERLHVQLSTVLDKKRAAVYCIDCSLMSISPLRTRSFRILPMEHLQLCRMSLRFCSKVACAFKVSSQRSIRIGNDIGQGKSSLKGFHCSRFSTLKKCLNYYLAFLLSNRSCQGSNLESLAPQASALSIGPQDHNHNKNQKEIKICEEGNSTIDKTLNSSKHLWFARCRLLIASYYYYRSPLFLRQLF